MKGTFFATPLVNIGFTKKQVSRVFHTKWFIKGVYPLCAILRSKRETKMRSVTEQSRQEGGTTTINNTHINNLLSYVTVFDSTLAVSCRTFSKEQIARQSARSSKSHN